MHYGARGEPLSNMLIYREMNFPDVAKETIREFGLDWIGMLESASGSPADYGIPAGEWKAQGPRYR